MPASHLYCGAREWTQYSKSFTSAEERGKMSYFDLLATFFLMQHRILLVFSASRAPCCLMVNLESTRTPRCFSAKLLSSWSAPACAAAWGCSPQVKDFVFPCVEPHELPVGLLFSLLKSLFMAVQSVGVLPLLLVLYQQCTC